VGRGTEYHSRLTYNRALSDNSIDTLFLSEAFYSRKDCSGSPVEVLQRQYPKGIYTSARQRSISRTRSSAASLPRPRTSPPSPAPRRLCLARRPPSTFERSANFAC